MVSAWDKGSVDLMTMIIMMMMMMLLLQRVSIER